MKSLIPPIICLMVLINYASAQEAPVRIIQDSRIDSLLEMDHKLNEQLLMRDVNDGIEGWRIDIFFDSGNDSFQNATKTIEEFLELYPWIPAYIHFQEPYYHVRVGDYRMKLDAYAELSQIAEEYPSAFVVKDLINLPSLDSIPLPR